MQMCITAFSASGPVPPGFRFDDALRQQVFHEYDEVVGAARRRRRRQQSFRPGLVRRAAKRLRGFPPPSFTLRQSSPSSSASITPCVLPAIRWLDRERGAASPSRPRAALVSAVRPASRNRRRAARPPPPAPCASMHRLERNAPGASSVLRVAWPFAVEQFAGTGELQFNAAKNGSIPRMQQLPAVTQSGCQCGEKWMLL